MSTYFSTRQKILIGSILLFFPLFFYGQSSSNLIVENDSLNSNDIKVYQMKRHVSVVFPKKYETYFNKTYLKNRFTPDSSLIVLVEKKTYDQYINVFKSSLISEWNQNKEIMDSTEWTEYVLDFKERESALIKSVTKELKKLDKYDRQYLGLINEKGERIVLINIVKFKTDPLNLKQTLRHDWIGGFGEWFESNTITFEYVIDRDKLYFFGWTEL